MTLQRRTALPATNRAWKERSRKRVVIRSLLPGEPRPPGSPRRYVNGNGYMRLRWKVEGGYVETYEREPGGALVRIQPPRARRVDAAEVARLYNQGQSQTLIARRLGATPGAISRVLQRQGVQARRPVDYAKPITAAEVLRRYEALEGYAAIAQALGVDVLRVKATLVQQGVSLRGPGAPAGVRRPRRGPVGYQTEFRRMVPLIHARSGGRCEARVSPNCSGRGTHVHHRKLRSQGGRNDHANLLDTCVYCHMHIHANPSMARSRGMLVRQTDDPAAVPVITRGTP